MYYYESINMITATVCYSNNILYLGCNRSLTVNTPVVVASKDRNVNKTTL